MKNYHISDSEWKIMQAVWENPNITLKEIAAAVESNQWSYTTVRTLVTRLVEKGVILADKSTANNFKYCSAVLESDCKKKETNGFLSKVFDGSLAMLVSNFTKDSNLTKEEEAELFSIIEKMETNQKKEGEPK